MLCDWEIESLARAGMIAPFEAAQVRDGVSYGLSSAGYDMRLAGEFKILNAREADYLDPKNPIAAHWATFTESDYIEIPPHGFVLGRSVEYWRIPTNVVGTVVGKCVTGDTRIVDAATGNYMPISDFVNDGHTIGLHNWRIAPFGALGVIRQGIKSVYELTTKRGLKIRTTAEHPFRVLPGWKALNKLEVGEPIATARNIPIFGTTELPDWEAILLGLMISEGQCHTPGHSPCFTSEDPVLIDALNQAVRDGNLGTVSQSGDFGHRIVNKRGRGGIAETNRASLWLRKYGLNVGAGAKFVPPQVFMSPKRSVALFLRYLFGGDGSIHRHGGGVCVSYCTISRRLIDDVHHLLLRFGITSSINIKHPRNGQTAYELGIYSYTDANRFLDQIGFPQDSIKWITGRSLTVGVGKEYQRSKGDTLPVFAWNMAQQAIGDRSFLSIGIHARQTKPMSYINASLIANAVGGVFNDLVGGDVIWDYVDNIQYIGEQEVYDISVPEVHNFIANDFVIHNSTYARNALFANVTPLEPGWEGYLTIELTNGAPVPSRVYIGEGICQAQFHFITIPNVTYRSRNGKYQNQPAMPVLAKV
jgi:deoxycytidine triphosphate deaminase/intein/homing endonuclease